MKKFIPVVFLTFFVIPVFAQNAETAWREIYPQILKNISAPVFKNQDYNIRDFGAVANDSTILNNESIDRAIATCSLNGGGRVIVPEGIWHNRAHQA